MIEYKGKPVTQMDRQEFLDHFADVYFGRVTIKNWQLAVLQDYRSKFKLTEDKVKAHG